MIYKYEPNLFKQKKKQLCTTIADCQTSCHNLLKNLDIVIKYRENCTDNSIKSCIIHL